MSKLLGGGGRGGGGVFEGTPSQKILKLDALKHHF